MLNPTRLILMSSVVFALSGVACSRGEDDLSPSAKSLNAARENVREQAQGVRDEAQALAAKQDDLDGARADLTRARGDYTIELRARLAKLDARLAELRARTDDKSRLAVAALATKRDQLSLQIDSAPARAEASWGVFKSEVGFAFDAVERDLETAMR